MPVAITAPVPIPAVAAVTAVTAPDSPRVSLAHLLDAGVVIGGDEAIAIAEALCRAVKTAQLLRRIRTDPDDGAMSPSITLDTVSIDLASRGGIAAESAADLATAIHSVGRIVTEIAPLETQRLLDSRRILEGALASPPWYESLDELANALAAHLQSDGRQLIESVYARYASLSGASASQAADTQVAAAAPNPEPRHALRLRPGYHPATVAAGLGVAAAALAIVGWLFLSSSTDVTAGTGEVLASRSLVESDEGAFALRRPVPPQRVVLAGLAPARSLPPAADRRVAPAAAVPIAKTNLPPPARAARVDAARAPVPPRVTASAPLLIPVPLVAGGPAPNVPAVVTPAAEPARPAAAPGVPAAKVPVPRPATVGPAQGPSAITYSAKDADVSPPLPLMPRLLASLEPSSPGVRLDALTIAVVVSADGTAYSVNAVTPPQNMGEYVLLTAALSAVKGWQFTPATKDGAAVTYRLILPLRAITRASGQ